MLQHRVNVRVSSERWIACKSLVHDATNRINIRAVVQFQTTALLRAHVEWTSEHFTSARQLQFLIAVFAHQFGNTEVQHFDLVANHHDVAWFQVSVNHSACMCVRQRIANLNKNIDDVRETN